MHDLEGLSRGSVLTCPVMWRAIATLAFQVFAPSAFPSADSPTQNILLFVDHPPVTSGCPSFCSTLPHPQRPFFEWLVRTVPPLLLLHSSIFGQNPNPNASQGSSHFVMARPTTVLRPATQIVPYPSSAPVMNEALTKFVALPTHRASLCPPARTAD